MDTVKRKRMFIQFLEMISKDPYLPVLDNFDSKKRFAVPTLEGQVYKWSSDNSSLAVAVKIVNLVNLIKIKNALPIILDKKAEEFYKIIVLKKSFKMPSLIEVIGLTLTNQLLLQNICPHFMMNYHWEYATNAQFEVVNKRTSQVTVKKGVGLIYYNELATEDMNAFFKREHSMDVYHNVIFQIFVALLAMRHHYNMYHIDLHPGNILISHQTPSPDTFTTYVVGSKKYYLPNLGYTVLLHDFGFAYIPNKLYIPWVKPIKINTKSPVGMDLYDINNFYNFAKKFPHFDTYRKQYLTPTFNKISHFKLTYWKSKLKENEIDKDRTKQFIALYKKSSEMTKGDSLVKVFGSVFKNYQQKKGTTNGLIYTIYKKLNKSKFPKQLRSLIVD